MGTIVIDEQFDKIRHRLKENIGKKRYIHSLGVSDTAACLAMRYDADVRKAALAGLVHDCAKGLDETELFETVNKAGIQISKTEEENSELLHSKAGSVIAKVEYGITDEEILSAIFWHTTGKPCMTLLEKMIFIADYIEPNRCNIPNLSVIRKMAFLDIDAATAYACENSLSFLKKSAKAIDKNTVDTYEYYKEYLDRFKEREQEIDINGNIR